MSRRATPLRRALAVVAASPLVLLAYCFSSEIAQSRGLRDYCAGLVADGSLRMPTDSRFTLRPRAPVAGEPDWFDREYRRLHEQAPGGGERGAQLLVAFAKPGVGYYACIVRHDGDRVLSARFVDRT